jgi:hypothetical protein
MSTIQSYSTNLGLSAIPEIPQDKYPEIYSDSLRIRNALRNLQYALDQYTGALSQDSTLWSQLDIVDTVRIGGMTKVYAIATDTLVAGNIVNLYNSSGLRAQLANATNNTKPARAICTIGGAIGAYVECILLGASSAIAGLTIGVDYYLSTTSGLITSTAPATVGNIVQKLGYPLGANRFYFNPSQTWTQL